MGQLTAIAVGALAGARAADNELSEWHLGCAERERVRERLVICYSSWLDREAED
jgi:hypothetical protein